MPTANDNQEKTVKKYVSEYTKYYTDMRHKFKYNKISLNQYYAVSKTRIDLFICLMFYSNGSEVNCVHFNN